MRLRDRQNRYGNLYPELIMVDNSDNHFKFFAPMTTSQVLMPNTLTQLCVVKEKARNYVEMLEA